MISQTSRVYQFRQLQSDICFAFCRVRVFLWLSNGLILKRKDKLEELRKQSLKLLMFRMLILSTRLYLEPCQWVMFLRIMAMVIRLALLYYAMRIFGIIFSLIHAVLKHYAIITSNQKSVIHVLLFLSFPS